REEEEIVLPVYAKYTDINKPEIVEMLLEHVQIRKGMTQLLADELTIEEMQALGVMLQSHIRKEEQVIFPMIEAALPEDEVKNLAPYLHIDLDLMNKYRPLYMLKCKEAYIYLVFRSF